MRRIQKLLPLLLAMTLLFAAAIPAFAADAKGTVTVKYVTGDNNKTIAKTRTLTGTPGKHFSVKTPQIKGYTFIGFTDDHPNDFTYPKGKMTVYVRYAKGVSATVRYTDMYGNTIYPSAVLSGIPGASYTVNRPYIKGYTLTQIQDPNHGVFGTRSHTVQVLYASSGAPTPAPTTTVRLTVQSIEQGTGRVLKSIADQNVMLPMQINLSGYNHQVPGYTYLSTLVNGVPTSSGTVALRGDTTVSYVYCGSVPTPDPVVEDATLYVYSVNEDTGDFIATVYSGNVKKGSSFSLSAPSYHGYDYDHTEVNGGPDWSSSITVQYDTTVVYYYHQLFLDPAPAPLPEPEPTYGPIPDPEPYWD